MKLWLASILLVLMSGPAIAQQKLKNNRYIVVTPDSTQSWQIGGANVTAAELSQMVTNSLVRRLTQKGLVRVKQLDDQCCAIQVEVIDASGNENAQTPHLTLSTRITMMDIDREHLYTKEYRGDAPPKAKGNKARIAAAADDAVNSMLADEKLVHVLAGS
jgi:hypothetical protein